MSCEWFQNFGRVVYITVSVQIISAWCGPSQPFAEAAMANHKLYAEIHGYDYLVYNKIEENISEPESSFAFQVGWAMPEMILASLSRGFDYVFWMDMDSYFTNLDMSLADLIKIEKDLVFTGDHNDICNGGHLLFKNSSWSQEFLLKWQRLSKVREKSLATTHLTSNGQPGCQIALVALLGNFNVHQGDFLESFNRVNGWRGNPDRLHKWFGRTHIPTTPKKIKRIKMLLSPEIRENIGIVEWRRLNAYHNSTKVSRLGRWRKGDPIIHLVAGTKEHFRQYVK